ncbi:MAG TPA: hypothetical protein VLK84_13175 [Longimicrobium sp.]|nr:hypothetical protein [Longimicrobium sp.]
MDPQLLAVQVELGEAADMELLAGLSDDDFADAALAAAIQRELEEEDAAAVIPRIEPATAETEAASVPGVLPLRRPAARPARGLDRRWLAAAAVLAGVTLLPLTWRASQGGAVREPSHAVAMMENPAAGLPAGWLDQPGWSGNRGGGGTAIEPSAIPAVDLRAEQIDAVRLGAQIVDLELAVHARDTANTRLLAARIADGLRNRNTAGTVAASSFDAIAERAGADPSELLPLVREASEAESLAVDPDRYALGAWVEAARLAAARRDAAFFREGRTRRTLESAKALVGDDETAKSALTAIGAASDSSAPDWNALTEATKNLLGAIAS